MNYFIEPPDLLIYLKASVPYLIRNIQKRGREYESSIRLDDIEYLNERYDRWIENAFEKYHKDYHKIISVGDLVKTDRKTTQIIKFHGDFDDDNSIVLDETSYFKRLEFESPLDIKLRSDVLGKTVLFIGYSVSDINIRLLFYKLSQMWKYNTQGNVQPQSYVFSHKPNPIQEKILEQWGISMLSSEIDDAGDALIDFMSKLTQSTS